MNIMRTVALFCLLVFIAGFVHAQNNPAQKNRFLGIYVGYTNSHVVGTMVEKDQTFNERRGLSGKQENRGGFTIAAAFQQTLSSYLHLKYGLGYVQKHVHPQKNGYTLYKDTLKTGYLSLPLQAGVNLLPAQGKFDVYLEGGPILNVKLLDFSKTGPDRVELKTSPAVFSIGLGAGFSYETAEKIRLCLNYQYMLDISNSYVEYLYWSGAEPRKPFTYKYRTHIVTFGIQWPLHK